jgi:hypothetical protein
MRSLHRFLGAALAALASAFALTVAAAPATAQVSSLTGENLVGTDVEVIGNCNAIGTSTITFRAEGMAVGPYSGTFVEEGTITLAAVDALSFDTSFTIFVEDEFGQPTGEVVTGTKTLGVGNGFCQNFMNERGLVAFAVGDLTYDATITTETGTFRDTGVSRTNVIGARCSPDCQLDEGFSESFVSRSLLPVSTTGKATGGGQFLDATSQEQVTFGFEVKQPELGRLQGRCLVLDHASDTKVKCLDVTNYVQLGTTATWEGTAEVNGVREHYRITVQDNGEPNQGLDTFAIDTESYDAAGPVQHGNVQLHKQQ